MIFGRKHIVCTCHTCRTNAFSRTERTQCCYSTERNAASLTSSLSLSLSFSHSLPLSFPLSGWTSLSPLHSRVFSAHSKLFLSLCPVSHNGLATHALAFRANFTFCKMYAQDTKTIHTFTVAMAALTVFTLCPLLPAPLAQDNQPKAHFTIKIHRVINMILVNGGARGS